MAAVPDSTFVETLTAWSTLAAALATAASVGFIAWQIRLTRQSVQASEKTAQVALEELNHNRLLQRDAQRARIDSEMPRLSSVVKRQSRQAWIPDEGDEKPYDPLEQDTNEVAVGTEFELPRDASLRVQVGVEVNVVNDGPRGAWVYLDTPYNPNKTRTQEFIEAGGSIRVWVVRIETVDRWVDLARIYTGEGDGRDGTASDAPILTLTYTYPGDVGAIERHTIVQGGSILVQTPGNAAGWTVAPLTEGRYGGLHAVAMPFKRVYYASLSENRLLVED